MCVLLPWRVSDYLSSSANGDGSLVGLVPEPGDSQEVFDLPEESSICLVLLESGICLGLLIERQRLVI